MNHIFRKLRSDRGSSMVLALFLMLVSLMVSHTILAAAATAGQNVVQQRESQQAYLTVSSAAEVFRDSVLSFSGQYQRVTTVRYNNTMTEVIQTDTAYSIPDQGPFSKELESAFRYVLDHDGVAYVGYYTIQVKDYEDVSMELTLEKDSQTAEYILTAVFSNVVPGTSIPDAPYRMAVTIRSTISQTVGRTNEQEKWKETIDTWSFNAAELGRADTAQKEAAS